MGKTPRLVTTMKPEPPNLACMVCGRTQLQLHINTQTTTLGQLVDKARRHLALVLQRCSRLTRFKPERDLHECDAAVTAN